MADDPLLEKIQSVSDLELAVLLCLVAREHCLISTILDSVDELAEELRLAVSHTFGLTSAIVSCDDHTTLDEFATALLVPPAASYVSPSPRSVSPYRPRRDHPSSTTAGSGSYFPTSPSASRSAAPGRFSPLPTPSGATATAGPSGSQSSSQQQQSPQIANVILAKDLDRAPRAVQIQALELLRTRRIFTRTSRQATPKQFLFIAIVGAPSGSHARVTPHLNDFFYLAHWHDPDQDGFPHLDASPPNDDDDAASTNSSSSVVKRISASLATLPLQDPTTLDSPSLTITTASPTSPPLFRDCDISLLAQRSTESHVAVPVTRYMLNLVSHLRMHRAVGPAGGGVSPRATKHFDRLARSLASLHGLDFVTPSLVALAMRKVYLHRLATITPQDWMKERSAQWGSDKPGVVAGLEGMDAEEVIEDVLATVVVPV